MRRTCAILLTASAVCLGATTATAASPGSGRINEPPDLGTPGYGLPGTSFPRTQAGALTDSEIADGLREALREGVERAIHQLGAADGFGRDRFVGVPLPDTIAADKGDAKAKDSLKTGLNHAAETATADAGPVFEEAIRGLALNDARRVLDGPRTAATEYLRQQMGNRLREYLRPKVEQALKEAGALAAYDSMSPKPTKGAPDSATALTEHVLNRTMAGIFHYVSQHEATIRTNPAARTSPLLQRVFAEPVRLNQPAGVPNQPSRFQSR